jgi:hypothetical protein
MDEDAFMNWVESQEEDLHLTFQESTKYEDAFFDWALERWSNYDADRSDALYDEWRDRQMEEQHNETTKTNT